MGFSMVVYGVGMDLGEEGYVLAGDGNGAGGGHQAGRLLGVMGGLVVHLVEDVHGIAALGAADANEPGYYATSSPNRTGVESRRLAQAVSNALVGVSTSCCFPSYLFRSGLGEDLLGPVYVVVVAVDDYADEALGNAVVVDVLLNGGEPGFEDDAYYGE